MGRADGNLGYSPPRERADALAMRGHWSRALGLDPETLVSVHQVHGSESHMARSTNAKAVGAPRADGLITADRGIALLTLHADCMPIVLCDPAVPAIGTLHAGWRGTTLDLAGKSVQRMVDEFGARPERMIAYLGPAIAGCCYEVGADVVDAWRGAPNAIAPYGSRWRFDLYIANRWLLRRAGLQKERIESSGICTKCGGDDWFSHRGQGPLTGRFGSIIALT